MRSWLWQGGEFVSCDSVPIADRGFRYGMSVFESFRVVDGAGFFLLEHLERLERARLQLGFDAGAPTADAVKSTLRADGCSSGLGRLCITAGEGGVGDAGGFGRVFLYIEERVPFSEEVRERGYRLGIEPEGRRPLFGGLKTGNYWANATVFHRARKRGEDEVVLLDQAGRVLSASMANLFIVRGGEIETPPVALGARDGVVRSWVCKRDGAQERVFTAGDLRTAEEIFLTNSWFGIVPVASLEGDPLPGRSKAVSLLGKYEAEARAFL